MPAPKRSLSPVSSDARRHGKLMSKLLMKIVSELQNRKIPVTTELVDTARARLEATWSQQGLSDRELHRIVDEIAAPKHAADKPAPQSATSAPVAAAPPSKSAAVVDDVSPANERTGTELSTRSAQALLMNTSKKQRQILADAEWSRQAEEDRLNGIVMKKQERLNQLATMGRQREILDAQLEEHRRQQEEEERLRQQRQREMDEHIENHRKLTRQELADAHAKAAREKEVREQQQRELTEQRERARTEEHNQQVRHLMMLHEEMQREKERELERKRQQQSEWKKTLEDNRKKLEEKAQEKQRTRALDREYQRLYVENMDKVERERAEAKARKEARSAYFQQLANGVAKLFMAKEQDLSSKIESEYQEQLRRAMEDENNRKQRNKLRLLNCLETQRSQIAERKRREEEEREESRRFAENLRNQSLEAQRQEDARRQAARAEAQRMREFLDTQLQMAHFKETLPLQTSIMRPQSRASTMYSPSLYTPSPAPK